LDVLSANYITFASRVRNKGAMNKEEFSQVLGIIGLGGDKKLVERLFWVFDDEGNESVDYKELVVGLEMFKDTPLDDKLMVFFDLCDLDGTGLVDELDLYNVLKANITSFDDRAAIKQSVKELYNEFDPEGNGTLNKSQLIVLTLNANS